VDFQANHRFIFFAQSRRALCAGSHAKIIGPPVWLAGGCGGAHRLIHGDFKVEEVPGSGLYAREIQVRPWSGGVPFQIKKEIAAVGGMGRNRDGKKLRRLIFFPSLFADRFFFLAHRKGQMHARMALVGAVGPYQAAIDVFIGGWLYLVAACCDVLNFQVLEHQGGITVI